jgi:hypothetical protein
VEIKEPPIDSTPTAPITTADNIVGGEPRVNRLSTIDRIKKFFCFV